MVVFAFLLLANIFSRGFYLSLYIDEGFTYSGAGVGVGGGTSGQPL